MLTEELLETDTAGGALKVVEKDTLLRTDLNIVILELLTGATEPVKSH